MNLSWSWRRAAVSSSLLVRACWRCAATQPLPLLRALSCMKNSTNLKLHFTQTKGFKHFHAQARVLSTGVARELDDSSFHKLSNETLDELADFFEDLGDSGLCSKDYDVTLSDGVLTIRVGGGHGTYVINKQSPNKQIWLSSPSSGPKRFDVIDGRWRYFHDGVALHDLLQEEFGRMLGVELDLQTLPHAHLISDEGNWA